MRENNDKNEPLMLIIDDDQKVHYSEPTGLLQVNNSHMVEIPSLEVSIEKTSKIEKLPKFARKKKTRASSKSSKSSTECSSDEELQR